jgi:hypothetical protein
MSRLKPGILSVHVGLTALFLISTPANANQLLVPPETVIGILTADWNDDGRPDRAILLEDLSNKGTATLLIYLSQPGDAPMQKVVHNAEIATVGSMWGQQPALSLSTAGSLIVTSMNESIGRTRWEIKLTIAYRKQHFVVAGYTYSRRDTIDLDDFFSCDVNFLTGKGEASRGGGPAKPFEVPGPAPEAEIWINEVAPVECQ